MLSLPSSVQACSDVRKKNPTTCYALTLFLEMDVQRGLFVLCLLQVGLSREQIGVLQSILFFANVLLVERAFVPARTRRGVLRPPDRSGPRRGCCTS